MDKHLNYIVEFVTNELPVAVQVYSLQFLKMSKLFMVQNIKYSNGLH